MRTFKRYIIPGALSFAIGFVVWFVTADKSLGFVIGLLTNLTFLSVEHYNLIWRVSRYLDTHREVVDSTDDVVALASRVRTIEQEGTPLARAIASAAVARVRGEMDSLAHGRWTVHSFEGFVEVAEKLFERFGGGREYWGTSVCREYKDYWPSALGRRFLDASVSAMQRGAKVKRIFICPTRDELARQAEVMTRQHQLGIEVRYLIESETPTGVPIADFGIWDQKSAVELSEARYQGAEFRATFLFLDAEVARLVRIFNSLYSASTPFTPSANSPAQPQATSAGAPAHATRQPVQ